MASSKPTSDSDLTGKVGFFWIVMDRGGRDAIMADAIELTDAEHYGELLTHPCGHYDFWGRMKQRGPAWLRGKKLSAALLKTEYEDWPRGRVVYSPAKHRFIVYGDTRIKTKARMALLRAAFQILEADLMIKQDSHYRPASIIPYGNG